MRKNTTTDTIYGLFSEQAAIRPGATALIDGRRRVTFNELDSLVDTIAAGTIRASARSARIPPG